MIEEGYEALNYKKNSEIYNQLGFLENLRLDLQRKIELKQGKIEQKLSLIDKTKQSVFSKIDNFFNQIIQIATSRKEQLKQEYSFIEEKERSYFATGRKKIEEDSSALYEISQGFTQFFQTFNDAEDFNKNTENMDFFRESYQQLQKQIDRKANFYKVRKFNPSEFKCIESDLVAVQNMGKIMDNSLADAPLVLFDSQKFAAFEYQAKGRSFQELPLIDTENFTERIPKDFKSIYVGGPEQSFLLVGGFDIRKRQISNAAYLYQKGKLKEVLEMYLPRQFFGICSNLMTELASASSASQVTSMMYGANQQTQNQMMESTQMIHTDQYHQQYFSSLTNQQHQQQYQQMPQMDVIVFVVGGFNDNHGSLKQVESFSMESKTWRQHSAMNVERINPGCCTFEKQYVYVFGGRSADARADFYDSIERLNTDLNLWSFIKIRLPEKLCNLYAFTVKKDYILILGGLKRISIDSRTGQVIDENYKKPIKPKYIKSEQKVDSNVYMYSQAKQVWFNLRPLSKEMKVCNVIPTGDCRFNCFLIQKPTESQGGNRQQQPQAQYPLNIVYDLKIVCPRLDRYWYFDHTQKAKQRQMHKESDSLAFLKSVKRDQKIGGAAWNQAGQDGQNAQNGQDTPDSVRSQTDPYHSRNFEWERRYSNFRQEDLGQELECYSHQSVQGITGDSLNSQTDFEKAAETGEVDFMAAMQERSRMSKKVRNFARISLRLGKANHTRDNFAAQTLGLNLGIQQLEGAESLYQTQQIINTTGVGGQNDNQQFYATQNTHLGLLSYNQYNQQAPEFGLSLEDMARSQAPHAATEHLNQGDMMGAQIDTSDSEDDLISAFK